MRLAIDFVREGRITPQQALQRLSDIDLNKLTSSRLTAVGKPIARGTAASAGIGIGRAAFDAESVVRLGARGDPIILVRHDTSTADVAGFAVSAGIVTAVGGRTAHAALVARNWTSPALLVALNWRWMWTGIVRSLDKGHSERVIGSRSMVGAA